MNNENVNKDNHEVEINKDDQNLNKRKDLHNRQMPAIENYFAKCKNIKPRTRKDYVKIIQDFIKFSPDINLEDLESFMVF